MISVPHLYGMKPAPKCFQAATGDMLENAPDDGCIFKFFLCMNNGGGKV